MRLFVFLCCMSVTVSFASCNRDPGRDKRSNAASSIVAATSHSPSTLSSAGRTSDEWVLSRDGKLALRLKAQSSFVKREESFVVVAEIENRSSERLTVLRPFGDDFIAVSHGIEIRNAQGKLAYTGAQRSYVIGSGGFATLEPGETVEDRLELLIENFAGIENAGRYTLQYDYSYSGEWDATAAKGGIQDAWRGSIRGGDIEIIREN